MIHPHSLESCFTNNNFNKSFDFISPDKTNLIIPKISFLSSSNNNYNFWNYSIPTFIFLHQLFLYQAAMIDHVIPPWTLTQCPSRELPDPIKSVCFLSPRKSSMSMSSPSSLSTSSSSAFASASSSSTTSWFSGIVRGRSDRNLPSKTAPHSVSTVSGSAGSLGPVIKKNHFQGVLFRYGPKSIQVLFFIFSLFYSFIFY